MPSLRRRAITEPVLLGIAALAALDALTAGLSPRLAVEAAVAAVLRACVIPAHVARSQARKATADAYREGRAHGKTEAVTGVQGTPLA